mgnify:CR=1 FL=1
MEKAIISERLNAAFEDCVKDAVERYGNGSRKAKLRLSRRLLGLTQREFSETFGIPAVTVRNWEAPSRPEPEGLAGAFIDLAALVSEDSDLMLKVLGARDRGVGVLNTQQNNSDVDPEKTGETNPSSEKASHEKSCKSHIHVMSILSN